MSVNQESSDIAYWNEWVGEDAQWGVLNASEKVMGGSQVVKGLQTSCVSQVGDCMVLCLFELVTLKTFVVLCVASHTFFPQTVVLVL